ncbi:Sodium:dicarboxylate symporter [Globomyces pollinis-pini]|nr:Sodium:dicarboxylate symporter [Globomyces pollinis-pini]
MGIAAFLAVGVGATLGATTNAKAWSPDVVKLIGILGDLWLRSLRAIVLPLIFTNMVVAAHSLSHIPKEAGNIAKHTLIYYLSTTLLSCIEGLVICLLFVIPYVTVIDISQLPKTISDLADETGKELLNKTPLDQVMTIFTNMIPTNIFAAFTQNDFMGVIVTGVVVGFLIRDTPESPSPILKICKEVEGFVAKLIAFLISVGPIGVFFLILPSLMVLDIAEVAKFVGIYVATCIGGVFFHQLVVYPLIYFGVTRKNPYSFFAKCSPSLITALGTSSSAATLPVTMNVAKDLGIPPQISGFCINIGTTCNMDGAAIGFPIAVIFQAAALGKSLSIADCVIIVITSAISAIGASPIPSAGLVLILMIMNAVGIPITPLFGLIIAIDFLVDRFQTALNVMGDLMCSSIVYHLNPLEFPEDKVEDKVDLGNKTEESLQETTVVKVE